MRPSNVVPFPGSRLAFALTTVLVVAALVSTSVLGLYMASTARAYVFAEGLWSKSTVAAIVALDRYVRQGRPEDLQRFKQALQVPLELRRARETLEVSSLPVAAAAKHFADAGLAAEDALLMAYVYRLGRDLPWTQTTVAAWQAGDIFVDRLIALSEKVRGTAGRPPSPAERDAWQADLLAMSDRFDAAERAFAQRVGERSRSWVHWSVLLTVVLASLLAAATVRTGLRSQRQQAQARVELEAVCDRLTLATQSDHLGVFEWEVGDAAMRLDARACELYGVLPAATMTPVDRSILWSRVPEQDHDQIRDVIERAAHSRHLFKHRYRVIPKPAVLRHVEITGVFSAKPGTLRMVGVIRDVSDEVHRVEARARQRVDQAAADTRSRMLSRLSHELRTPLNAILGFAQLLLSDSPSLRPDHQRWAVEIDRSGKGLLRMVDDVLRIGQLTEGALDFAQACIDLSEQVQTALSVNEPFQQARQVSVVTHLQCDALIGADPDRLAEALNRLFEHVFAVSRKGAQVTVTLEQDGASPALKVLVHGWDTTMDARQTGVDGPSSRHLGFALALVDALVQRMGGSLEVLHQATGTALLVLRLPAWSSKCATP